MELKPFATALAKVIWEGEQRTHRSVQTVVLEYVHDAVEAQLAYRRRMRDLDRRLADLEEQSGSVGGGASPFVRAAAALRTPRRLR